MRSIRWRFFNVGVPNFFGGEQLVPGLEPKRGDWNSFFWISFPISFLIFFFELAPRLVDAIWWVDSATFWSFWPSILSKKRKRKWINSFRPSDNIVVVESFDIHRFCDFFVFFARLLDRYGRRSTSRTTNSGTFCYIFSFFFSLERLSAIENEKLLNISSCVFKNSFKRIRATVGNPVKTQRNGLGFHRRTKKQKKNE